MVDAVSTRDLPLIQSCAMIFCLGYLTVDHGSRHHRHPVQPEAPMTKSTSPGRFGVRYGYRFNLIGVAALSIILALGWHRRSSRPHIIPHSVGEIVDADYFGPMSRDLWFGSDYLGRDMFSRILMGARYTRGHLACRRLHRLFRGVALGMTAAVTGGWFDSC